ncbi:MAG: DUF1538 domain-containing protein [Oscillospiraceae bacterium]|jgi:hypothetical protein|nr:DUF1538 domain-containing protein [Oscillospiraceae bacterium]
MQFRKKLAATTKEALAAVSPVAAVVFILTIVAAPVSSGTMLLFLIGAVLLVVGMGLFTLGAETALLPLGADVGAKMTASRRLLIVAATSFATGSIITAAEPDLRVLAGLVPGVPQLTLVITVAAGVGLFLIVAALRVVLRISLSRVLIVCYLAAGILAAFAPNDFVAVAFDSGGVTTGPITVPFILALGVGLSSIRSDRDSREDSFGLVALGSVGPVIAVLLLGIFFKPENTEYIVTEAAAAETTRDAGLAFVSELPHYAGEMLKTLLPLFGVLVVFQLLTRRYRVKQLARMTVGFVYTLIGLVLFMTGVNVGFMPVGMTVGAVLADSPARIILIPLGAVIGFFIVAAEPAVHVLKRQVEEISLGAIPGKTVMRYLSVGVSVSVALSMLRVLYGIPVYYILIPGYAAALALMFVTPKLYTGIAFDSGGVVSGPMATTFVLPLAIGACRDPARIMTDAFGVVALIAMTPLIAIQLMGLRFARAVPEAAPAAAFAGDTRLEFDEYIGGFDD